MLSDEKRRFDRLISSGELVVLYFQYHLVMNWCDDNRGWNNWIANGCILDAIMALNPVAVLPGVPGPVAGLTNKVSQAGIHYLSTERKYNLIILKTVKYQQVLKKESEVFFFLAPFSNNGCSHSDIIHFISGCIPHSISVVIQIPITI